jgi:hypothetical protein
MFTGNLGIIDDDPIPSLTANRDDIALELESFSGRRPRMHDELELSGHFSS